MKKLLLAVSFTLLAFLLSGNWADINAQAGGGLETPLMAAAREGNMEMAKFLIEVEGVEVDRLDAEGNTALIAAAGACHRKISRYLLDKGAEVNVKNNRYGSTPLTIAAGKCDDTQVIRVLLDHGADVRMRNRGGDTPLLLAVKHGNQHTVEMLLRAGAEINEQNEGYTALMIAARRGYSGIVALLIARKADVNFQNKSGETALSLAQNYGQPEVAELLKKGGARE